MNVVQCQSVGNNNATYNSANIQYVSPDTLFSRSAFRNLSRTECIEKARKLGWQFDVNKGKFYKLSDY